MSLVDLDMREASIASKNAARATDKLLELMCQHHPEYGIKPPKVDVEPQPEPVVEEKPKSQFWFWPDPAFNDMPTNSVDRINKIVCKYFGVTKTDLISARRTAKIVRPRQVAAYISREKTTKSLPEIGRRLGGRDHTTILHAANKIERLLPLDPDLAFDVAHIEAAIDGANNETTHS